MPQYKSDWQIDHTRESTDEEIMGYISDIYSAGEEMEMLSEYVRIKVDGVLQDLEYLGASALDYSDENIGPIEEVEMEIELPEGYLEARYSLGTSGSFQVQADIPTDEIGILEEELGENFRKTLPEIFRSVATYATDKIMPDI